MVVFFEREGDDMAWRYWFDGLLHGHRLAGERTVALGAKGGNPAGGEVAIE